MAEVQADRLYPALLDRLTDDEPSKKTESPQARAVSLNRLREAVLRDLNWLFNSTQSEVNYSHMPLVDRSVLNFGLPGLSGQPASSIMLGELSRSLREILVNFEPRLIPDTVRVEAIDESPTHNIIAFKIYATLWSQPVPIELLLRTDINLENGQTQVIEFKSM